MATGMPPWYILSVAPMGPVVGIPTTDGSPAVAYLSLILIASWAVNPLQSGLLDIFPHSDIIPIEFGPPIPLLGGKVWFGGFQTPFLEGRGMRFFISKAYREARESKKELWGEY